MSDSLLSDYARVSRQTPCPVCSHTDWCLVSRDDPSDPSRAICQRVESDRHWGDAGWLHVLKAEESNARPYAKRFSRTKTMSFAIAEDTNTLDCQQIARDAALSAEAEPLVHLAKQIGVSAASLALLNTGYLSAEQLRSHRTTCRNAGAFSFPMVDQQGRMCGMRLRTNTGFKYAMTGSRQGIFVPENDMDGVDRLYIVEGVTDCAALLDLGLNTIGRPSCTGGTKEIISWIDRHKPAEVVVVADNDEPGQRGAGDLCPRIVPHAPSVRYITPPKGIKDARAWKAAGANANDINKAADAAPIKQLEIRITTRKSK